MKLTTDILEEDKNKYMEKENKPKKSSTKIKIIVFIILISLLTLITAYAIYKNYIPTITEYELVGFTTKENDNSYIEIQISDNNYDDYNKYLKYITIDNNDIMYKNKINIELNRIKFKTISYNEQPKIIIEKTENIFYNDIYEIYTFYLPKEDIEKLKNEM